MIAGVGSVREIGKEKGRLIKDLFIGVVIALVSVPISMGYASVAGLPVIYGLYGSLLPILLFGLISSSPRFVFGVDAAPAALCGALLLNLGITSGSEEAVRLIPVVTLLVAFWLLFFRIIRAGRILRFVSSPVMGGFISGIGTTIILMQIPKLFGGSAGSGEAFELVKHLVGEASSEFHLLSFALGLGTVALILILGKFVPKLPAAAIVMIAGAALELIFHLDTLGVKMLPSVEAGLPRFILPDVKLILEWPGVLIPESLSIALVIFSETLLATGDYAVKYDEKLNRDRETLAYSAANLASAVVGCCPVNGSVSRSKIADQYGITSQLMSLSAAATMALILLFATPFIRFLPVPILTAIVISALIKTLEFSMAMKLRKSDPAEWMIFLGAFFCVLIFGTIYGVLAGIILSAVTYIIRSSRPPSDLLGYVEEHDDFYPMKRYERTREIPETVIYRFRGNLFYASMEQFRREIEEALMPDTKQVIVDAGSINSIDLTAAEALVQLYDKLKRRGIRMFLTRHDAILNDQLRSFGATKLIDEGAVKPHISAALAVCGIQKPYFPEESSEHSSGEVETGTLELVPRTQRKVRYVTEFEWAYGKDADQKLENMVSQIMSELSAGTLHTSCDRDKVGTAVFSAEKLLTYERMESTGYWNNADEDEFLHMIEERIILKQASGEEIPEREAVLDAIIRRRIALETEIEGQNDTILSMILKRRAARDSAFRKEHPEAYELLLSEYDRFSKAAEVENPALRERIRYLRKRLEA
ncbi:MAG: SulP family inorganic anion transporter [Lachnospiraceae bacterium]|nr:SulP family inorganic anion transporter [Lachnospiraceae bacterium]